jgi:DNA-binding transcriptional ArsR family regulator
METNLFGLAEEQAARCRVFGNARRLAILWMLSNGELPVNEIAEKVGSSLQNVSQHLNLLKKFGIVTCRRAGQTIYYQVVDKEGLKKCPAMYLVSDQLE